jgi:two-component system sensor histidine kinase TctE
MSEPAAPARERTPMSSVAAPAPTAAARPAASLRTRMSWRVLLPLALTWLLGSGTALVVATIYVGRAFDRSLLDDALAIAVNVVARDEGLVLNLSARELASLLYDQTDQAVFAVRTPDGRLIAGRPELRALPPEGARAVVAGPAADADDQHAMRWEFGDGVYRGQLLRVVSLHREGPTAFDVTVGLTTTSRDRLLRGLLLSSLAPQAVLLLLLGAWLRGQIGRELKPLTGLQQALDRRDAGDLAPIALPPSSRDVTRLADATNALMARIERAVQAQREFAGNVAHDLRTPLAGIRALAEHGLAQGDPDVWRQQLQRILVSEQRATRLVDQLLALAFADEARDSLRLSTVMLDEVVRDAVLQFLPRADAAGVDLGAVGLDRPTPVTAHLALLEGVLSNLIDNALRYGRPEDGSPPRITVAVTEVPGAGQALSVRDNGPGLPPERRAAMRGRWAQGEDGLQRREGAGLGLAIVSRYAALMQAPLVLEDAEPGRGLAVTLVLAGPVRPAATMPA